MDENHKKSIARNTTFLYIRMFVVMAVTFYTSRVVLHALGEIDYGIYDVVGGIVMMMTFINGSLSASTSRFLTYELGRHDHRKLADTFAAALNLHICAALLVIIIGETVGVWFLYNHMTIPPDKLNAAFWILQFSIITTCFVFTQVPFNASIISHENMSVFAFVGLYEAFSRLAIAFLITLDSGDRLILYGFLLMANSVLVQLFYRFYTHRKYPECRMRLIRDRQLYKKLLGYSGWDIFGNTAIVVQNQGLNIVLNIFYGPTLNAARAIAVQIQTGLKAFITNFLMAVRPRVVKLYAEEKHGQMYRLTFYGCKISFFLMLAMIVPITFNLKFLLHTWLGNDVPPYTQAFASIILCIILMESFHSAYLMAFHAIGRIKTGNLICGTLMICALPVGYLCLRLGLPPYSIFLVILAINIVCQIISWQIVHSYVNYSYRQLIVSVYLRCFATAAVSVIAPLIISAHMSDGWGKLVALTAVFEIVYAIVIYMIGFDRSERDELIKPVMAKLLKKAHR